MMNKIMNNINGFSSKLNVPKKLPGKYFEKDKFTVSELFTIKSSNGRRMAIPSF